MNIESAQAEVAIRTIGCGVNPWIFQTGFDPATQKYMSNVNADSLDPVWQVAGPFRGSNSDGADIETVWSAEQVQQLVTAPQDAAGLWMLTSNPWTQAHLASGSWGLAGGYSYNARSISINYSAQPSGSGDGQDDFAFMLQFNLASGIAAEGVRVDVAAGSDNTVAGLWVNGQPQTGTGLPQTSLDGATPYTNTKGYSSFSVVTLTGFQEGLNTIVAQVKSSPPMVSFMMTPRLYVECDPIGVADEISTPVNTPIDIAVGANDKNMPSSLDALQVTGVVGGDDSLGTWEINPDNTVKFTPAEGYFGTATAVYTATVAADEELGTSTPHTISAPITVSTVPLLRPDLAVVGQGDSADIAVFDNDVAWPDSAVTAVSGDPAQGEWVLGDDGVVHFTPVDGFAGTAAATYTVTGPDGRQATGTVRVAVPLVTVSVTPSVSPATTAGPMSFAVKLKNDSGAPVMNGGLAVSHFTGSTALELGECLYDDGSPAVNGQLVLDPDASVTCVAPYTVTQADLDAGTTLQATAGGWAMSRMAEDQPFIPAVSKDATGTLPFAQTGRLTLTVPPPPLTLTTVGAQVAFQATIANDSNQTAHEVGLRLDEFSGAGDPPVIGPCVYADDPTPTDGQLTLAPGASATCPISYTVTATDAATGGLLSLTAVASGKRPDGATLASGPGIATMALLVFTGQAIDTAWDTTANIDALAGVPNVPEQTTVTGVTPTDAAQAAWWSLDDTGKVVFDPPATFKGAASATVAVTLPDGVAVPDGVTVTRALTVTVAPAQVSVADASASVDFGETATLTPVVSAPDGSTAELTPAVATQGDWSRNTDDGTVTFVPATGFAGEATATLTMTAPDGTSDSGTLTVTVADALQPTPNPTPIETGVPSPDPTPTDPVSPTPDPTPTSTQSASPSPDPTPTDPVSPTPDPTSTPTQSASPSPDPTPTGSTDPSGSPTPDPSGSPSQSATPSPSGSTPPPQLDPAASTLKVLGLDPPTVTVDSPATVQATVVDSAGQPMAGVPVTFTVSANGTIGGASSSTVLTDDQGQASVQVTLVDALQANPTVSATVVANGVATPLGGSSVEVPFTSAPSPSPSPTSPSPSPTSPSPSPTSPSPSPSPSPSSSAAPASVDDVTGTVQAGSSVTLRPRVSAGSSLAITQFVPAQGTWRVNPDNSVEYTPASGFTGEAQATVTATAPDGTQDTALLSVMVTAATDTDDPGTDPGGDDPGTDSPDSPISTGGTVLASDGVLAGAGALVLVLAAVIVMVSVRRKHL